MRILMTADAVGGVFTYVRELCIALHSFQCEILVVFFGGDLLESQRNSISGLSHVKVIETDYRLEWMENSWNDVRASGEFLMELASSWHPDIVHLNGFMHGAMPWKVPTVVFGHSCCFSWALAVHRVVRPDRHMRCYFRWVQEGLRAATIVSAPSETMLRMLDRLYGPFSGGGAVLNGRKIRNVLPVNELPSKEPVILTAGRLWDNGKNMRLLDTAGPDLPWPVFAAGSSVGPGGERFVGENITLLGVLSEQELREWYLRSKVFVLPALYEPFGYTALEAAQYGCILVLADIPSLREIWGDSAIYFSPHSIQSLIQAVSTATLHSEICGRSRTRAFQLSAYQMAKGTLTLYQRARQRFSIHHSVRADISS